MKVKIILALIILGSVSAFGGNPAADIVNEIDITALGFNFLRFYNECKMNFPEPIRYESETGNLSWKNAVMEVQFSIVTISNDSSFVWSNTFYTVDEVNSVPSLERGDLNLKYPSGYEVKYLPTGKWWLSKKKIFYCDAPQLYYVSQIFVKYWGEKTKDFRKAFKEVKESEGQTKIEKDYGDGVYYIIIYPGY